LAIAPIVASTSSPCASTSGLLSTPVAVSRLVSIFVRAPVM
jgi:hypothetical protein